jgi:oxygen-independent coproporphyrinogen-3 oxidase
MARKEATVDQAVIDRHSAPVPRYTSYPTAPHFNATVDRNAYASWLRALEPSSPASLYLHVPFCDRLCWFCGCHTKQVRRYEPIADYARVLRSEIALVAEHIGRPQAVTALHFGGGSPSMLEPADVASLRAALDAHFALRQDCEISLEVDPNDVTADRLRAWAAFGVNRVSFGVQDFDDRVQHAINRIQTYDQTKAAIEGFRGVGVRSVNLDVLYGLPHQTAATLTRTVEQVIGLAPDRVALFGYAHVPWMKKHQRLIETAALPDAAARFEQAQLGARLLTDAGYLQIGIDHFALPDDGLAICRAAGKVRRNFQGYTTDDAPAVIGLGASAIGRLPQGYVQNVVATADYARTVQSGRLATVKGFELTQADNVRAAVIERLMCDFGFSLQELRAAFGGHVDPIARIALDVRRHDKDGLTSFDGQRFAVTVDGRPFVRTIASRFDHYFQAGASRHSAAV